MHSPRTNWSRAGARIWLLTTVLVTTTGVLGLPATALAANTGKAATGKADVVAACTTPGKGQAACFALRRTDVTAQLGVRPADSVPSGFGATDLRSAYRLPADGGAGATVAIVDAYDDPTAEADLAIYRAQYGLPACTTANGCFQKVDQRGGTDYPAADTGWSGEISLDLDMVSAVAPAAHILLVEGDTNNFSDLGAAVDEAVALGAKYVSNSYGSGYDSSPGSGEDPTEITELDPFYNHPGVAVVASSGDGDYGVSYPAASPYVTAVGGTSLYQDSSTRGFSESVWNNSYGGPGSGCSVYEPKPAHQTDSGCGMRTVADVSAVADPATGVSVYQTFGGDGWSVYGGTSASSPIIAGVYAAAGTPVAGTYPNSYPYAAPAALNDVTTGDNGSCTPAYLCTAGTGYDGPTGLGTPNGTTAFTTGPHGEITGTVNDASTGTGLSSASVTAGDSSTITDSAGHYDLRVPVGSYDVTAAKFGYGSSTIAGVAVAENATVTEDFALSVVPRSTVGGVVTDGSGQNWPLYAKITVDGIPGGPVFTNPANGHYSIDLPRDQTYTLHVTPVYGGYTTQDRTVTVGAANSTLNVSVPVDAVACDAAGYQVHFVGTPQTFDGTALPDGWTVSTVDGTTGSWGVTDVKGRGNLTGGTGGFAIIDSDAQGTGVSQDSTLTMPAADLSSYTNPTISFDTDYRGYANQVGDVDLSVDGGASWTNLWHHTGSSDSVRTGHVDIAASQAAGKSGVLVRFHFTGSYGWWWELDNVVVGNRSCDPVPGGLVFGQVSDANTHADVTGAVVTSVDHPAVNATTMATPDDPALGDGFYWLYTPDAGSHQYAATRTHYTSATSTVNVAAQYVTEADFTLSAGQITVSPTSVSKTVAWGGSATATLTLTNTGTAPATVALGEQAGATTPATAGATGAPLNQVKGTFTSHSPRSAKKGATPAAKAPADVNPSAAPWTSIADYPTAIQDNAVVVGDGKVYSAFGYNGTNDVTDLYVYDPESGAWSAQHSAVDTREKPVAAWLSGKLYAAGGWGASGDPDAKLEIYDPAANSWTTGAAEPTPLAGSGVAVVGGKMYSVGGCTTSACGSTAVQAYDPVSNSWSTLANYPESISWVSCGGIAGKLYCAGGTTDAGAVAHSYVYDPAADTWSPVADLPHSMWASAYTAAGGSLLVSGGVIDDSAVTNQGFTYDPGSNAWTALPNANNTLYRSGSACGLYRIGGSPGGLFGTPEAVSEVLPGMDQCAESTDVSWLSLSATSATIQPGKSVKVKVTVDASDPSITQPGAFTAAVTVGTDTPYPVSPVGVTMVVNPPKTWGEITGTVTSAVDGKPIAGATVQIDSWATSYTLKTDKNGQYQLWLDYRNNPLTVIVAKDGYQPQVRTVKITKGATTTASFVLLKD
jgi:N-acetylneuraminic acid mutarotase